MLLGGVHCAVKGFAGGGGGGRPCHRVKALSLHCNGVCCSMYREEQGETLTRAVSQKVPSDESRVKDSSRDVKRKKPHKVTPVRLFATYPA